MITNPSIGEIVDRMAVLRLKIINGSSQGKPIEHFLREQDAAGELLSQKLWDRDDKVKLFWPVALELAQLHQKMWDRENDRREWQKAQMGHRHFVEEAAAILEDLGTMNEKRNALREEINKIFGTFEGEEKL